MHRVYLSSTLSDLQEYRKEATDVLLRLGATPVAVEDFPASSEDAVKVCSEAVRGSDLVVLIVAHRYGVVPPGARVSIIEGEFDVAVQAGLPVLPFVVDSRHPWPKKLIDQGDAARRLAAFKERLRQAAAVETVTTPSDFGLHLLRTLSQHLGVSLLVPPGTTPAGESGTEVLIRVEKYLQALQAGFHDFQAQLDSGRQEAGRSRGAGKALTINPPLFLGASVAEVDSELCFVAMPYSKTWSTALQTVLADICRQEGFRVLVAKDMAGRFVPHDIWNGITSAGIVIADITDGNPNVAYEIGLADVLGREVVLICQGDTVPFDFLGQRLIQYRDTMEGTIKLREELAARLRLFKAGK